MTTTPNSWDQGKINDRIRYLRRDLAETVACGFAGAAAEDIAAELVEALGLDVTSDNVWDAIDEAMTGGEPR